MALLKQICLIVLGAVLILSLVLFWRYATGLLSQVAERGICWMSGESGACKLRGYARFSVWMVVGIVNLLVIGGILERLNITSRRR